MNILLDNIIYSLQKGGGASVVWTEHVKRLLIDPNYDISFYEYDGAKENFMRRGVAIPEEKIIKLSNNFIKITRYFNFNNRRETPYIFHSSHYRIDNGKNAKNVTTVHDFVYEYYVKGLRRMIHSKQKWNAIRKADKIICISESTKHDLLHFLPDVNEDKITVIYNGVDERYRPIFKDEYGLDIPFATGEFIVYVGNRHTPYKNFKLAVEVCQETKRPLIFIGGELLSKDEKIWLDSSLGKGHYLSMRGISNKTLNEIYNRSFAVLYPSLYEGFGIPVIEAQKAGAPVICSQTSSIQEVAGLTDLCIPDISKDAIIERLRYLESEKYRSKEVKQGIENSTRFSWDRTYQHTTDLYMSLLEG